MTNSDFNVVDHLLNNCGFGTQANLAAVAKRRQSAVSVWKKENSIPSNIQVVLIIEGRNRGHDIGPNDFFPPDLRSDHGKARDEAIQKTDVKLRASSN